MRPRGQQRRRSGEIKVLLINPPILPGEVYGRFGAVAPRLPTLGLGYLAAFLRRAGHAPLVVDAGASMVDLATLRALILREEPQVIGVTATTISFNSAIQVVRMVEALPGRRLTLLGGAHISALPARAMGQCPVDLGVVGEGEHTLLEICERYAEGAPLSDIDGTVVRGDDGAIRINAARAPEEDLDRFPPPDRELLYGQEAFAHTPFRGTQSTISVISSRGCPFSCGYCDQSVYGRTWRAHSAERVLEEVEQIARRDRRAFVSFEDDNFMLKRDRVRAICRGLRGQSVEWGCSARVTSLDPEILSEMRAAGCSVVYVGIESASPRVLELLGRRMSTDQAQQGVQLIKAAGIRAYGSFVLGTPTETRAEIFETIRFAAQLPLDGASFFLFVPYPKTRLRELAHQEGRVSDDWSDYSGHPQRPPYTPREIPAQALLRYQSLAYLRFFLRWSYVRKHLPMVLSPSFIKKSVPLLLRMGLGLGGER